MFVYSSIHDVNAPFTKGLYNAPLQLPQLLSFLLRFPPFACFTILSTCHLSSLCTSISKYKEIRFSCWQFFHVPLYSRQPGPPFFCYFRPFVSRSSSGKPRQSIAAVVAAQPVDYIVYTRTNPRCCINEFLISFFPFFFFSSHEFVKTKGQHVIRFH